MSFESAVAANRAALVKMSPQLGDIVILLQDVRGEVAQSLSDLAKKHGVDLKYSLHVHRSLMLQLDDAIEAVDQQLPIEVKSQLTRLAKPIAGKALENLKKMMLEGEKRFGGAASSLRLPLAAALKSAERSLAWRHASSAARYAGSVGDRIRREMAIGAIKGETIGQTARRLTKIPRSEDITDVKLSKVADKQFFKNQSDAERLLITEQVHAYTQAQIEGLREANRDDPGWRKMWDATIDKRTCPECRKLDGEIVGWNELFSCGLQGPPLHPYCRCALVPMREGWSVSS